MLQNNLGGEWEPLASFDKDKQMWAEGKVQGGALAKANSRTLSTMSAFDAEGENKKQILRWNYQNLIYKFINL